jgi:predicted extracellular nuclease
MKTKNLLTTMALTLTLLLAGKVGWGQTTINFDTDANWIQDGTTALTSYANHAYQESGVLVQGTNVLRNTTSAQDGFPGALGTYSMRIGNTASSKVVITVSSGGVATFSIKVRRWDGSPMPNYTVKYSVDGGTNWTSLVSIDGTLLTDSDFKTYNGTINSAANNIKIEIANTGTTERIMIDDFSWFGFTDTQAPQATFNPLDAATNIEPNVTPTITFDEAIRNIDDSEITDANVALLLTLKETDASGADVPFTATISADKKVITITPSSLLGFNQVYYLAIAPVEDESNNATSVQSITFTTRTASTDATVSSVVYTVDNVAETITNVPSSETLATFKSNITPAAGATFEVYESDGSTVATDLQTGYKLTCTAEDGTTKKTYIITLNTAASNDATVSSTVYTVDNVAETITNVPWNETLATFKSNITPAAGATFEVYESDGTTVATDLQSGYKLTCTAEDGTTTKTYTITLNAHITVTSPNGGETFFAGDQVTITWTSANMDSETLKYEAYVRQGLTTNWAWVEEVTDLPNTGSLDFTIPADATYGTQYKIRLTGNTSGATDESDAAFTIIATPTIYDIQSNNTSGASNWADDSVRIGGIVTAVTSNAKNYYLQAGTGPWSGIYVYYNTTHTYQVGDSLTVVGKVVEYNNLTELTTSKAATVVNTGNALPAVTSLTTSAANSEDYESVLIKVTGATCESGSSGNYTVNDGSGALVVYKSIYTGLTLEIGRKYDITGVMGWFNSSSLYQLYPRSADDIYLYGNDATLSDLKVDGVTVTGFDPATLTYDVELPYGTTTVPTVTYTLNDAKATAIKTDAAALPGSTTVAVTAEDGLVSQTYTINFTIAAPNTEANILTYTVAGVNATIDNGTHTITATVPYTTDITNLVATFTLSDGATAKVGAVDQVSGVTANDFTSPVTYTVTAQNGTTTQDWVVTITKAAEPNHEANITAYSINGVDGVINSGDYTISVTLPYGTDVTNLVATFTLSTNATAKVGGVDQVSGTTPNDFTNPVTYTVTAEDGTSTQDWVVTVTVTPASSAKDITSFTISGQVSSTIDAVVGTVAVVMPYGTNVTALTPTIEVSQFATIDPASGVAQDFTNPVTYTVTAQDNSTKAWIVTVTVQPASNDATVSSTVYTVSNVDGTITNVPYNATLATFKSNITPAAGATFEVYQSDGTTVATDLQTGYKLICTAQDGTTTKTYTITLNPAPATPIVYEPFDYTVGTALQGQGGWTAINSGDDLLIATGNLSYPDLAPSTGNKLSFAGGGIDAYKEFNASGITSGKVYYSFILKVTDLTAATEVNGGYFIGFAYDNTNFGATVWTKRVDDNSYQIGINSRTNTANTVFTSSSYAKDAEVFIVASYEVVDGTGNDVAKIWINPAPQDFGAANEPASTLSITNTGGTDLTSVKRIFIRQDSDTETPAIELDELRIGDTWAQVTPAGALSNDATVTSTVYTVDSNAGTITNVPQTETLANFKANITPAAGATFEVYQADGTTVATDLQTGYKLICTAEDGVTKKTYTITLNTTLSSEKAILSYSINGVNGTIDPVNHTVTLTLPYGTDRSNLVATFTLSAAATAKVGATVQVSGTTSNDFTSPVTYTVTAEDGSTQDWVVTVNLAAASTEKDILTFTIAGQVSSTIDAVAGTVTVVMPFGTNVTSLTPTITISQYATIDPASGVAQDFTNPVTYTVTAQDNSTKTWTVTVTVQDIPLTKIYSIQYTTDASGDSPLKLQQVRTKGIVTAVKTGTSSFNIWLQDSAKAWNAVYVYGVNNSFGTIAQGDSVELVGTVDEYNNLTEIKTVNYLNKINSGNTLPTPVDVTPAQAASEAYEGVLVKLSNVECTVADAGFGEFTVSDGTNNINIDDFLYKFTPTQGARYNITGVVDYSFSAFKVLPRNASDVESAQVKYTVTFTVKRSDGTTPVDGATINVTGQGNVTTDASGVATMQLPDGNYTYTVVKSGFDTKNGNFTVSGANINVDITLIQTGVPTNPIAKLSVYPNPFTDRIYFTGAEVTRVTITSVIGQVVMDRQVENTESIDVSSIERGIYLVRFYNSNGESVLRKLVKE